MKQNFFCSQFIKILHNILTSNCKENKIETVDILHFTATTFMPHIFFGVNQAKHSDSGLDTQTEQNTSRMTFKIFT